MRAYKKNRKLTQTEKQKTLDVQKAYFKKRTSEQTKIQRQNRLNAQKAYFKKRSIEETDFQKQVLKIGEKKIKL